jgi:hypothetical protein
VVRGIAGQRNGALAELTPEQIARYNRLRGIIDDAAKRRVEATNPALRLAWFVQEGALNELVDVIHESRDDDARAYAPPPS